MGSCIPLLYISIAFSGGSHIEGIYIDVFKVISRAPAALPITCCNYDSAVVSCREGQFCIQQPIVLKKLL